MDSAALRDLLSSVPVCQGKKIADVISENIKGAIVN